ALFLERQHQVAVLLQSPAALLDLLRLGLVLPETGRGGAHLQAAQLIFGFGCLKENSEDRRRACSNRRNVASVRRQSAWGLSELLQISDCRFQIELQIVRLNR